MMNEENTQFHDVEVTRESVAPLERLVEVAVGKEETLERLLNLLQSVDDKGFLKILGYLVDELEDLVDAGIQMVATPEAFNLMSSGSTVIQAAKAINVSPLPKVAKGINGLIQGMVTDDSKVDVHGAFDLIKLMKDPDIRFALSTIFSGLKAFGKAMRTEA